MRSVALWPNVLVLSSLTILLFLLNGIQAQRSPQFELLLPEEQKKEPTLGEKGRVRHAAKHKLDTVIKKVAQKKLELKALEQEYLEALGKAERAEEVYAQAIKDEYNKESKKDAAVKVEVADDDSSCESS